MNQYSDSESHDSEEGIRYKTDSTRYKQDKNLSSSRRNRARSRSRSPKIKSRRRDRTRSRSRSPRNRHRRRDRRRSRTPRNRSRRNRRSNSEDLLRNKTDRTKSKERRRSPLLLSFQKKVKSSDIDSSQSDSSFGPLLTKKEERAPILPPHSSNEETKPASPIGPRLPPHLHKNPETEDSSNFGPQLPPHLKKKEESSEDSCIGPQLPPHLRQKLQEPEDSDEDTYGPLPADALIQSKAQLALEERALQLKMDQLEPHKDKPKAREEWMLELPEVKRASFGLGPRQFRSKEGPDLSDRSSWTDTPNKKEKKDKIDLKKDSEKKEIRKRDEEQEKIAKKHKKKSKESLLEMHQTKRRKEKKDEGPSERKPFNRETDLQVNRFDEAQRKAVLKKAQLLDDRFSSGQSKFL